MSLSGMQTGTEPEELPVSMSLCG
uniref:Uncharacterized protein n=1 Tax=Anguilla anguilla TaxID=7936 RepID=A0A0E9QF71_ANGAN